MPGLYRDKLRNTLSLLENENYPSLGPHLHLLGFTGLWHPTFSKQIAFKQALFFVLIAAFFSQYLKCFINLDPDALKLILQYAPFHLGIVKSCFFHKNHKVWENLINYIASVEKHQLSTNDRTISKIINAYIGRNRRVTYFFWGFAIISNFSIFSEVYLKNQVFENGTSIYLYMFDFYTPFERRPPGYYASMFIQTILGNILSAYVVGWDTLVVSIMIFYTGQLKVARVLCKRVVEVNNKEKSRQNIAEFHRFYIMLIAYQKLFNSLIAPVMFLYLIVISVNLGVCIIGIVQVQDDVGTLLSSVEYVLACLIQLLLFYWHSNEVTVESTKVSYAVFESDWIETGSTLRREVAMLGFTTTKRMVFAAGPFNEMSLATFIAILRASYSFYTLMNGTN